MKQTIFALVDCNNFFVSCQRLFRPDLEGKPVVVLSSNDGCVVARSNEAKGLGIPMGAPAFKYRQTFKEQGIVQFSANFELYGDISRRITSLLATVTPRIEVYSVDESFLDLSALDITDLTAWGKVVRQQILRYVGVPVSIGIAPSKTLAKLASEHAKKVPDLEGVLDFTSLSAVAQQTYLQQTPIQEVWGIGRRLAPRLRAEGIADAAIMRNTRPGLANSLMGVHGRQLVAELQGTSCLPLELSTKIRQSIAATRTFGEDTSQAHILEAALASFVATATFKLRTSQQLTRQASFFLTTNRHKPGYKVTSKTVTFNTPTADAGLITRALVDALATVYSPGQSYHRAGVWLQDFVPAASLQTDLLGIVDIAGHNRSQARMQALDSLNKRYGKNKVHLAAEILDQTWRPKRHLQSPRYTTNWLELPRVSLFS